jgi:Leucine-rich repeat (LRR) protein
MHDLVYDLARTVMKEELVVYNANKVISMADRKYCRYAVLTNCCKPLKISTILPAKLRALLFHDCRELGLRGTTFSFAKCLRVLDLTESSFIKFPDSIAHLKQLRFLIAPGMENQRFPDCIAELSKLKYLDFSGPKISTIPESIGKLECLVHLDLSGCSALQELPETLCDLTKLQYINLSRCYHLRGLPQDLDKLMKLQYLNLSNCKEIVKLPETFGNLTNLMHLDLKECRRVSNKHVLNGLSKLWYLNLSGCFGDLGASYFIGDIDYICSLTNLEHLDLSINFFHSLPECIGHLRRLRTLDLSWCIFLRSLPESIASLDNLEQLLMDGCSDDVKEAIRRYHFKRIPLPHFVVHPEDGGGCSNLHKLADTNPDELEISCLENVRTLEEAQGVGLCNKEKLLKLTFHWSKKADALEDSEVLGELVPPRGLEHLKIEGYRSRSFPKWIMSISDYLPNITSVVLQDLPACSILPPLGQLPKLKELNLARLNSIRKITGDLCGGQRAFLQLSRFILEDMKDLEEWNTTYFGEDGTEEFMFPVLHKLVIYSCPRLRLKPCPPIFHSWRIEGNNDEVLNSGEEGDNFGHFNSSARRTKLSVYSIPWYRGGWRLLHHLPTLRELYITNVNLITSLPESMRQLASLRLLRLSYCSYLSIVPEWLGDLKSLEVLRIWGCRRITSLPSSIQQLTNLQLLEISDNRSLTEWSQSKENKMKLAHIKHIVSVLVYASYLF